MTYFLNAFLFMDKIRNFCISTYRPRQSSCDRLLEYTNTVAKDLQAQVLDSMVWSTYGITIRATPYK